MQVTKILKSKNKIKAELPLFVSRLPAGFPSPADDYIDKKLDLNDLLIRHPEATFFVKAEGDSMINAGIQEDDILIVDRALEAKNNDVIVAVLNGELLVKRLNIRNDRWFLLAETPKFHPIELLPEMDFDVWGVVTYVIHKP